MMNILPAFFIKSIACSGIFYLYYQLMLKNRKMHMFNRFYLLCSVLVSLIIPFLHFEWQLGELASPVTYQLLRVVDTGFVEQQPLQTNHAGFPVELIPVIVYAIVSISLLFIFGRRLLWLRKTLLQGEITYADGVQIVHTGDKRAPFSFMNTLYWPKDMRVDNEAGEKIWTHEMVHIRQKHTLDKLWLQAAVILFWINPFYWLMQRECALLHEFIADDEANKSGDTEQLARMLLQTLFKGKNSFVLNTFFHSPIKRRIMMIQKNNKPILGKARRLLVVPVIAASVFLFSFSVNNSNVKAGKKITILLDAGHGGEDAGGRNADGIAEKDLNLAIANRIMKMAADYNIEVISIRPEDKNVTLSERVAKVNRMKADLMISLHVNNNAEGSRYQLIVDQRNKMNDKSQKLASAINTQMQDLGMKPEIYNKSLVILKDATIPAVLIECGDINQAGDVAMLTNDSQLHSFCDKILTGIVAYASSK